MRISLSRIISLLWMIAGRVLPVFRYTLLRPLRTQDANLFQPLTAAPAALSGITCTIVPIES